MARRFGEIDGYPPGSWFPNRRALHAAGLHSHLQRGISGDRVNGADAIVLSGGYEDDEDFGDVLFYTGEGGNESGRQVGHQSLTGGNLALVRSRVLGRPIRVIRGSRHHSREHRPDFGYRYDGLYRVDSHWLGSGKSGFRIWQFGLVRIDDAREGDRVQKRFIAEDGAEYHTAVAGDQGPVQRRQSVVQRIVRNSALGIQIKELYSGQCQVCRTTIPTSGGNYSEAAHIRPLGAPHDGPDEPSNILCLCPNHHVMFDLGAIVIQDDMVLINPQTGERLGHLFLHPEHKLDPDNLAYHRRMFTDDLVVPFDADARSFRGGHGRGGAKQNRLFRAS